MADASRINNNDRLPGFIDRAFHGQSRDPAQLSWKSQSAQIEGAQAYKYFKRPLLTHEGLIPPSLRLGTPPAAATPEAVAPEPFSKDAATQSDYRESETQTLPWTPDYVLPHSGSAAVKQAYLSAKHMCEGPEVLQIADLKFGDGLPGGLQEVRQQSG